MKLKPVDTRINYREKTRGVTLREYDKAPRVYISICNESIFENLVNRHARPRKLFKEVATQALKQKGIIPKKLRWSQYAGCSCPCSPGFILDDYDFDKGSISNFRFDVFISADGTTE